MTSQVASPLQQHHHQQQLQASQYQLQASTPAAVSLPLPSQLVAPWDTSSAVQAATVAAHQLQLGPPGGGGLGVGGGGQQGGGVGPYDLQFVVRDHQLDGEHGRNAKGKQA